MHHSRRGGHFSRSAKFQPYCVQYNYRSFTDRKDGSLNQVFIKPPEPTVQEVLKTVKAEFDRPLAAECMPGLLRAATFPNSAAVAAWSGDMFHRIAEWTARQGNTAKARDLYESSLAAFHPSEKLGPARTYRDFAKLELASGNHDEAFALLSAATSLHNKDRPNPKGRRQARITQANVLGAQVLADDDRQTAIEALTEFALFSMADFCLRDQHDIVSLLLPHTKGSTKQALQLKQLKIDAARRRPIAASTSIAKVVIGAEVALARRVISSFS